MNSSTASQSKSNGQYLDLEPKKIIGSGSFGYVFEAIDKTHNKTVAVKRTTKAGEYVSREFEILNRLRNCQNVVKMLDIFYSKNEEGKTVQNIVFEYCQTNLEEIIQKHKEKAKYIQIDTIKNLMKQILQGMNQVHQQQVCHRDLKPENILITGATFENIINRENDGFVKICDFGSAKVLDESESSLNTPYIVSRYYRAPELIVGASDYTNKIDMWAIGCIFAELLTLRPLFPGKTEGSQLIEQIAVLGLPSKEELYSLSSQIDKEVINMIFKIDSIPKKQFNKILPKQIYDNNDIEMAANLLENILKWNPNQRSSCQQALQHPFFKGKGRK